MGIHATDSDGLLCTLAPGIHLQIILLRYSQSVDCFRPLFQTRVTCHLHG